MKFSCPCLGFVGLSSTAAGHTTLFTWWLPVSDDVIWKRFPRYWPFVRVIHRSSLDPPVIGDFHSQRAATSSFGIFSGATLQKPLDKHSSGQWCEALMISIALAWTSCRTNSRVGDDLRRHNCFVVSVKPSINYGTCPSIITSLLFGLDLEFITMKSWIRHISKINWLGTKITLIWIA